MLASRAALSLALTLFACAPAALASPEAVARALLEGRARPADVAASWRAAGLTTAEALESLREAARARSAAPIERLEVTDAHGRSAPVRVVFPDAPRADGRYGVLIVLHGLGGRGDQLLPFARRIAPPGTIVAAPDAQRLPDALQGEDVPGIGLASRALPHWWSYRPDGFALQALDELARRYPIDTDRVVLMGYSMGGYGTWNIGLRYSERFAAIVPLAGGISRMENFMARDARSRALLGNGVMVPSFVVHGTADRTVPFRFSRTITEELQGVGADVTFHPVERGPHILAAFLRGDDLTAELAEWVARQERSSSPRRVHHVALGDYHARSYWVRAAGVSGSGRVVAEVTGEQQIEVQAENVARLTLFLDPDLIDPARPVTVVLGDRVVFHGVAPVDLELLAQTFAETLDPELSYAHAIDLDLQDPPRPGF